MNAREVLGVGPRASQDEIRAAYRKLAFRFHPDRNKEPLAAKRFRDINLAYEELSKGDAHEKPDFFYRSAGQGREDVPPQEEAPRSPFVAVESIIDQIFGSITESAKRKASELGEIRMEVRLSPDALSGRDTLLDLDVPSQDLCRHCGGQGLSTARDCTCGACQGSGVSKTSILGIIGVSSSCPLCRGTGRGPCLKCMGLGHQKQLRRVVLRIPPGISAGSRIRYGGLGDLVPETGRRGDLVLDIVP